MLKRSSLIILLLAVIYLLAFLDLLHILRDANHVMVLWLIVKICFLRLLVSVWSHNQNVAKELLFAPGPLEKI